MISALDRRSRWLMVEEKCIVMTTCNVVHKCGVQ